MLIFMCRRETRLHECFSLACNTSVLLVIICNELIKLLLSLQLEEKKLKRQSEVLLVYFLDSMRKNFLEIFKHTFEALGYKAVLLKHTGISTSIKKEWQGHRWCFNGGMEGNATAEMPCFQRNDPFLLQENQKVSLI